MSIYNLQIRDWQIVDAVLDNMISFEIVEGDVYDRAALGQQIRHAGWDQICPSGEWPSASQPCQIELNEAEHHLILCCLGDAAEINDELNQVDQANQLRRIESALAAQSSV